MPPQMGLVRGYPRATLGRADDCSADIAPGPSAARQRRSAGLIVPAVALLTCVVAVAALTSERADWQPITLLAALGLVMVVADAATVSARRIRISAGLTVQTTIMALLGPAPAVAIGLRAPPSSTRA